MYNQPATVKGARKGQPSPEPIYLRIARYYAQGLSVDEIVKATGMTRKAIWQNKHLACKKGTSSHVLDLVGDTYVLHLEYAVKNKLTAAKEAKIVPMNVAAQPVETNSSVLQAVYINGLPYAKKEGRYYPVEVA